MIWTVYIF